MEEHSTRAAVGEEVGEEVGAEVGEEVGAEVGTHVEEVGVTVSGYSSLHIE